MIKMSFTREKNKLTMRKTEIIFSAIALLVGDNRTNKLYTAPGRDY
jgi:hypothetical protein